MENLRVLRRNGILVVQRSEQKKGFGPDRTKPFPFRSSSVTSVSSVVKKLTNPDDRIGRDPDAVGLQWCVWQDDDVAPAGVVQGLIRG